MTEPQPTATPAALPDADRTSGVASRVALVTGGAVRVGRLIALGLARAGFDIVLHFHRSRREAAEVARLIEAMGRRCVLAPADLGAPTGAADVAAVVRARFGRLDVLVNSAAGLQTVPVMEVDAAQWDEALSLNARAAHLLVREMAEYLADARGCVVNIVDLGATRPWPAYGVHSVSKAALAHLTRVQARALAPRVRVNALLLGDVYPPHDSDHGVAWVGERSPLGRPVAEEDIVSAIRFAVSAETLTGSTIVLDAGASLGDV